MSCRGHRVLLVPVGTPGDIQPFIDLAVALRQQGHRPAVLASAYFLPWTQKHDLELIEIGTGAEFELLLNDHSLWNIAKAHRVFGRKLVIPSIPRLFQAIKTESQRQPVVVVGQTMAIGARIACEKLGLPFVLVHRQPAVLRSVHQSARLPWLKLGPKIPAWLKRTQWRGLDHVMDRVLAGPVNDFRAGIGLGPVHRVMNQWINQQSQVLGTWPEWFGPVQPDWPAGMRLVGFDIHSRAERSADDRVKAFLAAGDAPIVFTFGSGLRHGRELYAASVEICRRLGKRGILSTRFPEQLPRELPSTVMHAEYLPFTELLPQCAAVVHHGGIGTVGHALAMGVPQLIVSGLVFDAADHGDRIARLGCGGLISRRKFTARGAATVLKGLIDSPQVKARCMEVSQWVDGPQATQEICRMIQQVVQAK